MSSEPIIATIKLVCVDTETTADVDLSEWALLKMYYDLGKVFLVYQHVDVEALGGKIELQDQFHSGPGGMLDGFEDEGDVVEAKNEWD